jgi:hypothetical protein
MIGLQVYRKTAISSKLSSHRSMGLKSKQLQRLKNPVRCKDQEFGFHP